MVSIIKDFIDGIQVANHTTKVFCDDKGNCKLVVKDNIIATRNIEYDRVYITIKDDIDVNKKVIDSINEILDYAKLPKINYSHGLYCLITEDKAYYIGEDEFTIKI